MVKDRMVAGALAGVIGAAAQNIFGIIMKAIHLTDRAFVDFAQVFIMYKEYPGILAQAVGIVAHLAIGAVLGVVFAYLIRLTTSRYLFFKGVGFGITIWLLLGVAGTVFRLPRFKGIQPGPAASILLGAMVYGLVNAYMLRLIERKTKLL